MTVCSKPLTIVFLQDLSITSDESGVVLASFTAGTSLQQVSLKDEVGPPTLQQQATMYDLCPLVHRCNHPRGAIILVVAAARDAIC